MNKIIFTIILYLSYCSCESLQHNKNCRMMGSLLKYLSYPSKIKHFLQAYRYNGYNHTWRVVRGGTNEATGTLYVHVHVDVCTLSYTCFLYCKIWVLRGEASISISTNHKSQLDKTLIDTCMCMLTLLQQSIPEQSPQQ